MGKNKIKLPEVTSHAGLVGLSKSQYENYGDDGTPTFCFKHLHKDYNLSTCCNSSDAKFLKGLLKKLEKISQNFWSQIQLSDRQGQGTEKIEINSIKPGVPGTVSPDIKHFLSFYFAGKKGRLIGFRGQDSLFHVVYIDTKLSVYRH